MNVWRSIKLIFGGSAAPPAPICAEIEKAEGEVRQARARAAASTRIIQRSAAKQATETHALGMLLDEVLERQRADAAQTPKTGHVDG